MDNDCDGDDGLNGSERRKAGKECNGQLDGRTGIWHLAEGLRDNCFFNRLVKILRRRRLLRC